MLRSIFRVFLDLYVSLYRRTRGKFGNKVQGLRVLLLTTTGKKSGKARTTPLGFFEDNNAYVIIASNGGMNSHPAWFHNLRNDPRVTVEIGDKKFQARAMVADPTNRARFWARLIELAPSYNRYAKRTRREIPMVILQPL
ncbi:MAG: nitroreductase family deazaflavin-dependent oxidoreductase [Chloroflexi bacterium]|nr:nitroreductase family deazaflavin-dependent oxidoreductase [Chloroflexota bacterium]